MFDALDDRGKRVRTYRVGMLEAIVPQLVPRRMRGAPADVLWKTYWRLLRSEKIWAVGITVGIAPFVAVAGVVAGLDAIGAPLGRTAAGPLWLLAASGVLVIAATMVYARYIAWLGWWYWRASFLEERCCPGCGYWLNELAAEEDGCVVCPECGGAWRMEVFAAG